MSQTTDKPARRKAEPEPTWEIAHLFPLQGYWTEEEYLELDGNHLVEFSDGFLEVLPMPTDPHQTLVVFLLQLLLAFNADQKFGKVLIAPIRVRLWSGKFREPDIVFMLKQHMDRIRTEYWKGADLVLEVVSRGKKDRHRDLVVKRREYAKAKIAEYWIVDPVEEKITVLRLAGKRYVVHGEFSRGTTAASVLLPGFQVDVTEALNQQLIKTQKPRRSKRPQS